MKKQTRHFDFVENFKEGKSIAPVAVLLLDATGNLDFVFADWRVPVIRPNNPRDASLLADGLSDTNLSSKSDSGCFDELLRFLELKLVEEDAPKGTPVFIVVSSGEEMSDAFVIESSRQASGNVLSAVETNFSASKQKFGFSQAKENLLFQLVEEKIPQVSCFKLQLRSASKNSSDNTYSKERIFEETLVFSSLAASGRI